MPLVTDLEKEPGDDHSNNKDNDSTVEPRNAQHEDDELDPRLTPKGGVLSWVIGKKPPPIPNERTKYPEPYAPFLSKLTFGWITPLMTVGYKRTLQPEDLFTVTDTPLGAKELYAEFEKHLERYREMGREKARQEGKSEFEIKNAPLPKMAVARALNRTFFTYWWSAGALKVISDVAQATTPLVTKKLISFTMFREYEPIGKGVGYAICIVVMFLITSFAQNHFFHRAQTTGARSRGVLSQAIYKKSLQLSHKARITYTNGKLTNLLSTDCHRVDFALQWAHFIWAFPVSTGICLAVVLINLGAPGLVGFALLMVALFAIAGVGAIMAKVRGKVNKVTDQRVSVMREILQSMRIIKFYSWEDAYREKVQSIRTRELKLVKIILMVRNVINSVFVSTPTLAGLVSFVTLSATSKSLNPADVFSSLSSFNIMRMPLMILPLALLTSVDAFLALKRIEAFLSAEEVDNYVVTNEQAEYAIDINGTFVWEKEDNEDEDDTKKEKEEGVKTEKENNQLMRQLTREQSHNAENSGASVREKPEPNADVNISEENKDDSNDNNSNDDNASSESDVGFDGFENIDLKVPRGEFVIITGAIGSGKSSLLSAIAGQMRMTGGGVTLGGELAFCGQPWIQNATVEENITFGRPLDKEWYNAVVKACSLSRDFDILPAGDQTEVGERGITLSGGQKARINLARAVYWNADVVLLDDVLSAVDAHVGQHIIDNCLCKLMADKTRVLATHQLAMLPYADRVVFLDNSKVYAGTVEELRASNAEFDRLMTYGITATDSDGGDQNPDAQDEKQVEEVAEDKQEENKKGGGLMQEEDRASDAVDPKVYMQYFKLGGGFLSYGSIPLLLLVIVLSTFCTVFTNTWLSFWTAHKFPGRGENFYIGIFAMFSILTAVFSFLFFYMLTIIGNTTSLKLHRQAVDRILHAPMSFFDTSPLGRIVNRFTKDTDTMDNEVSDQARLFLFSVSNVIGVFILIIVYLPWFAIALVGLMAIFVLSSAFYRASAREVKRLDSLGRSGVFSHFSETISGISTIRAYGSQDRFVQKNEAHLDRMNDAYYLTLVNQRWLSLRLDWISSGLCLVVVMLCVTGQFNINPSSVGLVLSSLLMVVNFMSMVVREMATVENNMNAVERVYHYAYNVDQEAAFKIEATKPPQEWPQQGAIDFKNVSMSYQPHLPPVLQKVNATVKGGEKIGICGRTGAGKSSIMVALYRLAELSHGEIDIDGIDVSKLGLNDLRSKLSIIPQDPVLFQGTVRSNVDPFDRATDMELWDALKRSWLVAEDAEKSKFHLDTQVDDEGANFSLGERQLLALARALVRKSQILILDEATSSVDFETDHRIQSTIVSEFAHCTILCIAHRLRTILQYDRIMVLEAGQIVEFDTPTALFNLTDGVFRSMCDQSGITLDDFENKA